MAIVRWSPMLDPFQEFENMFKDMHPEMGESFVPKVDIYEKDNNVIVEAPLQGVDPDNVSIEIENDVLKLEGKTEKKTEVDDKNYYRKEVRSGSFHRAIPLPAPVIGDDAEAEYEDGILRITIPKAKPEKKKKSVKINVKK